jgi:hypothetical protein
MNNLSMDCKSLPERYIDPTGYRPHWYSNPGNEGSGGGSLNAALQRKMGNHGIFYNTSYRPKSYSYNEHTQSYQDEMGNDVDFAEVFTNFVKPNLLSLPENTDLSSIEFINGGIEYVTVDEIPLILESSSNYEVNVHFMPLSFGNNVEMADDQDGGGENDGLTLNEAATGVSAMSLYNSRKGFLLDWGMRGANWGKTGARYMKLLRGAGIAGTVFGMGVSSYNIVSDIQAGNAVNSWDVADLSVGAVGLGAAIFLASNPVGWVIAGGATIYFGARFFYDISTKP